MPEFDFSKLVSSEPEEQTPIEGRSTTIEQKKLKSSIEKLQQEINKLKKDLETLKQEELQERFILPEDVYNDLWLMCKSELSKWNKKSDSMLNTTKHIINYFHVDLNNNPFDKLKGSD